MKPALRAPCRRRHFHLFIKRKVLRINSEVLFAVLAGSCFALHGGDLSLKILCAESRLPQDGTECSVWDLLFPHRNNHGQCSSTSILPKFCMTSALGYKSKALGLKDFGDLPRRMQFRHTGAHALREKATLSSA